MNMGKYILRRIALFIPTLFIISLLSFIISRSAPGDPVDTMLHLGDGLKSGSSPGLTEKMKEAKRKEMGLDLPLFYFGLSTLADPDTAYMVASSEEIKMVTCLSRQSGRPQQVATYYKQLRTAIAGFDNIQLASLSQTELNDLQSILYHYSQLLFSYKNNIISTHFDALHKLIDSRPFVKGFNTQLNNTQQAYQQIISNTRTWRQYIPMLHFYGFDNQYHRWLSRVVLHADFGVSYHDRMPVMDTIQERFGWSFTLSVLSVLLAYIISLPIGVYAAGHAGSFFDKASSVVLFMMYSLPVFFVGSVLILFFATKGYLYIFPETGVQDPATYNDNWNFWEKTVHHLPYLFLPLITYTYSSLAYLSRQTRSGILSVLEEDYIRTARAKGLSARVILWKHALRNSILPMITIFAYIFPVAFAGAVIIETIFGIPGMGQLTYDAVLSYDYPLIVAIFSISGLITVSCFLLADILYAWADPRISYA